MVKGVVTLVMLYTDKTLPDEIYMAYTVQLTLMQNNFGGESRTLPDPPGSAPVPYIHLFCFVYVIVMVLLYSYIYIVLIKCSVYEDPLFTQGSVVVSFTQSCHCCCGIDYCWDG